MQQALLTRTVKPHGSSNFKWLSNSLLDVTPPQANIKALSRASFFQKIASGDTELGSGTPTVTDEKRRAAIRDYSKIFSLLAHGHFVFSPKAVWDFSWQVNEPAVQARLLVQQWSPGSRDKKCLYAIYEDQLSSTDPSNPKPAAIQRALTKLQASSGGEIFGQLAVFLYFVTSFAALCMTGLLIYYVSFRKHVEEVNSDGEEEE